MSETEGIFSRRTLIILVAVGGVAAAVSFALDVFGDGLGRRTAAPSVFSTSAIGHGSLVDILRVGGLPVVVSTNGTARKVGPGTTLVLAEPTRSPQTEQLLQRLLGAPRLVLVLPKWTGEPASQNGRWIGDAKSVDIDWPRAVLNMIDTRIQLRRTTASTWSSVIDEGPTLRSPQLMTRTDNVMTALIWSPEGVLLGRMDRGNQRIWILSDPDMINNHGIDNGDNLTVALHLFASTTPEGSALIFDETIHGFIDGNEVWRAAFRPPFLVPTLIVFITLAALLWNAVGRFGRALPEAPPIPAGHKALIDNTAELLVMGGQARDILRDYFDQATDQVAKALHIHEASPADRSRHLDQLATSRGLSSRHADLQNRVDAQLKHKNARGARALATDIHRWRKEMIHGS